MDAMPDGGNLTIETAAVHLDEAYCRGRPALAPGSYGALCVTDTGVGMDPATRNRIFDPFFSTKGATHSGLGLATVHGIVKQASGHVHVYSEPGHGTTFKIYLPRTDQPIAPRPVPQVASRPLTAPVTVMVVDDEPLVRETTAMLLERQGYQVLAAGSGIEAVARANTHEGRIDVLITDVIMPNMNGRAIAKTLRQARADLRVLYVSGYTENAIVHAGELDSGIHFLSKPYMPSALFAKVDEVLTGPVGEV
jgi:two-component system, cell cycle sensor histidine kinase and response regulator CckA